MFLSKTKVLIIDDSPIARKALVNALQRRSGIEIVGVAADAYEAKEMIMRSSPDVLLLDIDMPRMDGITFLKLVMKHHPIPVVMLSQVSLRNSTTTLDCLEAGAVDIVSKPSNDADLFNFGEELASKIKSSSTAKLTRLQRKATRPTPTLQGFKPIQTILMGASTGGTEALAEVLETLPANLPPIFIVQHIPAGFSKAFADRANKISSITVKEADNGEIAQAGYAYIAPGNYHMITHWNGREHRISLNQNDQVWHQRPAVDVLFDSVTPTIAAFSVSVILTGMGRDGARGLLRLKEEGSLTIGQDSTTCAVYGMPKAAFELGAVQRQLPLDKVPEAIVQGARMQSLS